jgi:tetratricopeptide (TPR) repeat protein
VRDVLTQTPWQFFDRQLLCLNRLYARAYSLERKLQINRRMGIMFMKNRLTHWIVGLASCALPLIVFGAGGGGMDGGGMGGSSMPAAEARTPEEQARAAYNEGVRAVKQAKKYEDDLAGAKDDKKAKAAERVRKQYDKARGYFANAASKQATMHEAWNYVGFTSRKLGEYDKALAAYDEALRLKPDYAEAIEYRGEAYVWMNRLEDAKKAYMDLYRDSREMANQLMGVMQQWVTERRADASGVPAADIDGFAQWLNERATIAQQTASLATDGPSTSIWQ